MVDQVEQNKNTICAYVEAINTQNLDMLDNLVSPDFVRHSFAAGEPGIKCRGDLIQFLRTQFQIFPNAKENLLELIAEGEKVAARHRFRGTQLGAMGPYSASGRDMDLEYIAIYRIEDGVIVEAWAEWDNYSSLKQLGHFKMAYS